MRLGILHGAAIVAAVVVMPAAGGRALAQPPQSVRTRIPRALQPQARIGDDSARAIALREVHGAIVEGSLEREHGRLVYSYDIRVARQSGVEEVQVDARTGAIVSREHESPEAEARERRDEGAAPRTSHASSSGSVPTYRVTKRVPLGGDGGWDYLTVDTVAHRLYLSRGTHVMVIDADRDSLVGDITDTPGVHGVAVVHDVNEGFTSNGRDSTVTVFDLATLAPKTVIHVGARNPDAIFYDAASRRVFTFNGGSASATAIDPTTNAVIGSVALGGKPEAAQADGGRIFVNIEDTGEVVAFDPRTLQVLARWALAPCEEPTGMGIDRAKKRLYIGCGGNAMLAVVDYAAGKLVTTVHTGSGIDGAGFDAATGAAFTSNGGDGTMSIVREDRPGHWGVTQTLQTMRGARTMTIDERTHRVYTVSATFGAAPAPTPEMPRPRPPVVPGSFTLIVIER